MYFLQRRKHGPHLHILGEIQFVMIKCLALPPRASFVVDASDTAGINTHLNTRSDTKFHAGFHVIRKLRTITLLQVNGRVSNAKHLYEKMSSRKYVIDH